MPVSRLVTVSMKTNEIVAQLPPIREVARPASWPAVWSMGS